ncbi:S-adenosyl-L-methionine-dependent methyltransferase [Dentipellis sp. KUC8613]|nr:S-adenosyl-L-methionine-dependent methyltransferase [Dentipellis sp. KUC8613]
MLPTPDTSHLTKDDFLHVYEPAEDTFLLLDGLEEDAQSLRDLKPRICLEIGSGSGCVSSFIGTILGPSEALYLCTDINPHAARCTALTGQQNKIPLNPILASLAGPLSKRLAHAVDVLLFNPPYVPTYGEEADAAQEGAGIAGSWAGGADGMQVTERLLEQIDDLLSPNGRFYLVAVKQNDIPGIQRRMLEKYGLQSQIVIQRRAGREHLFVVRFSR